METTLRYFKLCHPLQEMDKVLKSMIGAILMCTNTSSVMAIWQMSNNSVKLHKQCHFSNATVQISSGRVPIWQKSEVFFFVMSPFEAKELNLCELRQIQKAKDYMRILIRKATKETDQLFYMGVHMSCTFLRLVMDLYTIV